jgi:hypothetical protein
LALRHSLPQTGSLYSYNFAGVVIQDRPRGEQRAVVFQNSVRWCMGSNPTEDKRETRLSDCNPLDQEKICL